MKRICFFVALIVLPLIGMAQKESLLINQPQGVNAMTQRLLSSVLTKAALNSAEYQPVSSQERVESAMSNGIDSTGSIGKVAPCKYGLLSKIEGMGEMLLLTVSVLNLESASVEKIDMVIIEETSNMSTLQQQLSDFAERFFSTKEKKEGK